MASTTSLLNTNRSQSQWPFSTRIAAITIALSLLSLSIYHLCSQKNKEALSPLAVTITTPKEKDPDQDKIPHHNGNALNDSQLKPSPMGLIEQLKNNYGEQIHHTSVQIKLLEKLLKHCTKQVDIDCNKLISMLLKNAFPELADKLVNKLYALQEYHQWGRDQRYYLNQLSKDEKKRTLWEKRLALFGDEANTIWASEYKRDLFNTKINTLNNNQALDIVERLDEYHQVLTSIYESPSLLNNPRNQQHFVEAFFSSTSVQSQLRKLSPSQQIETLAEVRRTLGMKEDAIQRWTELDQERSKRWLIGQAYMQEREAITTNHEGNNKEEKFQQLRIQHFGEKAEKIAKEEASGYFRFSQPQTLGKN